ncbi:replication protein A 70 kDa DNA-binding subunit C-like protein [Tanacetum coccineum]
MSKSIFVSSNQTGVLLNQLELGATGTIVVMIYSMWDVNSATGRYLSTDFIVSDIKVNKEEFRVMRYADFMLEFDGDTTIWKSSVKSEGFNRYPFQFVEIDDLEPTNNRFLVDSLYLSSTSLTMIIDDEKIPVLKIDKVRTNKGWNYPSCGGEKCKKGNISRKAGQFWCDSCENPVKYPVIRYKLELEISDDTAEVVVVMFGETTTSLVKCSASSILGSEGQVVTADDVEGSASSGMVAAKADSKAPML